MDLCWLLLLVAGAGADTAATIRALDLGIATLLDTLPAQVETGLIYFIPFLSTLYSRFNPRGWPPRRPPPRLTG